MTRRVLMCEPTHYRIEYEINPWMRRANAVRTERANAQWRGLHETLIALGVDVELVEQGAETPDMTFTANAGIVAGERFIPANFRFPERQLEEARFTRWFEEHGYRIETVHEPHYWEGEGDVLPGEDAVFAGYRFRTEFRALDHIDELLGCETVRLELTDPRFYHLDTCLAPLGGGRALFYSPAFTEESRTALAEHFATLIAVSDQDAARFACNAVVAGETVVLNAGCTETVRALREHGLAVVETPMDEFIKAGGSVKCLLLMLDAFGDGRGRP
ncbi:MAG: amidinotransferase [Dehalococcoidia bacterium]|nr:amidinotransferase [Dehalococcoidia bacterium]MYI85252.1 amidinotransferase [Dehalococcoidia bacterium]